MADPISLLAVAGLVFAGRKLSEDPKPTTAAKPLDIGAQSVSATPAMVDVAARQQQEIDAVPAWEPQDDIPIVVTQKREQMSFGEVAPQARSSGAEILGMRDRMQDVGRMNNLAPVERQNVGPGLGVDANVPAIGGYQQLFRVNPTNVGEYRLHQLPGVMNHAADQTGGRPSVFGQIGHNRPEKTAYLPERLPPTRGRSTAFGPTPRGTHVKGAIPTNRADTGTRADGLQYAPAARFISAPTEAQPPTRFKSDDNTQFGYANQPSPGVSIWRHGYQQSPLAQVGSGSTNAELMARGLRPEDRRGQFNRAGNPGRMNVRENALKAGGALSSVRTDQTRMDSRFGPPSGGWMQQYVQPNFNKFNAFKGKENPHARTLGIASQQLAANPFAQDISR